MTSVGVVGAGGIGQAVARQMARGGCDVLISNSRGPESISALARSLGERVAAATVRQAADADIIVLAVPWAQMQQAIAVLPPLGGRIVVDAMNPVVQPGFRLAELGGRTSTQVVATLLPGARIVKAMNTLSPELLAADPRAQGGRRVLFMSGDDAAAKSELARLLDGLGFAVVDLGTLAAGSALQQFPGGPLPALNLIRLS